MSSDPDLGIPEDDPSERAWRLWVDTGVRSTEHQAEITKRQALVREWAEVGAPLR